MADRRDSHDHGDSLRVLGAPVGASAPTGAWAERVMPKNHRPPERLKRKMVPAPSEPPPGVVP